jgi:F-type H+-transporting ATPase subunit b
MHTILHKMEQEAKEKGGKFSAKLLQQFANPQVEEKIIKLFLEQISSIPDEKILIVKDELKTEELNKVEIQSAFPLQDKQRAALISKLKEIFGPKITVNFVQNSELLAGLCMTIDSVILHANLRDELKFFYEIPFHEQNR